MKMRLSLLNSAGEAGSHALKHAGVMKALTVPNRTFREEGERWSALGAIKATDRAARADCFGGCRRSGGAAVRSSGTGLAQRSAIGAAARAAAKWFAIHKSEIVRDDLAALLADSEADVYTRTEALEALAVLKDARLGRVLPGVVREASWKKVR
ncbi:MAG: hypothetical protein EXS24_06885 [Pedosphaera sp.]|nr:hypothetical protein [Pedosphaera sp.]